MASPAAIRSLTGLILGPAGPRRLAVSLTLLTLAVYLVFAVVQETEVRMGLIDSAASNRLTAFYLSGAVLFYVAVRLGLDARVPQDPGLTVPQAMFGITSVAWSYAITGPARGAVIIIIMLILLFGAFALRPRHSRLLALYAFSALAGVMAYKAWTDPLRYDPRVELIHFFFAVIIIVAVTLVAAHYSELRRRLTQRKAELQEAVERIHLLATRDEMTGLLNRRAMMERLQAEARRTQRGGAPMSMALLDIDHFKRINDTHGHAAGDRVLAEFAGQAAAALRSTDVLARWGGEEFMLLMPDTDVDAAAAGVQRLREHLRGHAFDAIAAGLAVTFSAGLARCTGDADLGVAIERADSALYRAKNAGRDRTESA